MSENTVDITSAKLVTEAGTNTSREEVIAYAKDQIEGALALFDIDPISAKASLYTEGAAHDPVQKIDIKIVLAGGVVNQSAHSRNIKKAIDRAIPELKRQLKRYKKKRIVKGRKASRAHASGEQAHSQSQDVLEIELS